MRIASLFTATFLSLTLIACGGSGGGDDTTGDDAVDPDADDTIVPDADNTVAKQIGDSCTPDTVDPMAPGDCGAGMTCLSLDGGGGPWCSKTCTSGAGDMCGVGYTGPGIAGCFFGIDFDNNGSSDGTYCGVICNDLAGDPVVCNPATACDGTCPGTLGCTAPLNAGMPAMHVADACI